MPMPFPILKYKLIQQAWKFARIERWFHRFPALHRCLRPKLDTHSEDNDATIIPIHAVISTGENVVLPYPILQPLIEKAAGHFILNQCPCRTAENCQAFPHDYGCLYLGPAVEDIPAGVGQKLSVEEALVHLKKGIEHGLVPMIVHASFDAEMLSIDYTQMLAVCFCCDCCCTVRHHLRLGPSSFDETIHRLTGLTVQVTNECTACGSCSQVCPVKAITMTETGAVIDQEGCKGCGLCTSVCPEDAIEIKIVDEEASIDELYRRIRSRTQVGV